VKPGWRTTKQAARLRHATAVHLVPRAVAAVMAIFLVRESTGCADAATQSTSFGVGATVVAGCALSAPALSRALRGGGNACAPATGVSSIPVPQPTTRVTRDPDTGLQTLTVEF